MELENIVANTVLLKAREGKDGLRGTDPWSRMVNPSAHHPTLFLRKRLPALPRNGCLTSSNSLTFTSGRIETGCQRKDAPLPSGTRPDDVRWRLGLVVVLCLITCGGSLCATVYHQLWRFGVLMGGLVALKPASVLLSSFLAASCHFRQASSTALTRTLRGCRCRVVRVYSCYSESAQRCRLDSTAKTKQSGNACENRLRNFWSGRGTQQQQPET